MLPLSYLSSDVTLDDLCTNLYHHDAGELFGVAGFCVSPITPNCDIGGQVHCGEAMDVLGMMDYDIPEKFDDLEELADEAS